MYPIDGVEGIENQMDIVAPIAAWVNLNFNRYFLGFLGVMFGIHFSMANYKSSNLKIRKILQYFVTLQNGA